MAAELAEEEERPARRKKKKERRKEEEEEEEAALNPDIKGFQRRLCKAVADIVTFSDGHVKP